MDSTEDLNDFELNLIRVFVKDLVFDHVDKDTPMPEVRELAEQAGRKYGRLLAVIRHEGDIGSDSLMFIRSMENEWKERFLGTVERQLRPGGEIREAWNSGRA